jgi:hypothetical protein
MKTMHRSHFSAVEGTRASGANGIAPDARREETDPDWQPL